MASTVQTVPDTLVYEMVDGNPIYYKGYRDYLSGEKQIDEIMGSSYLQGVLATELVLLLGQLLDRSRYRIISNEIGLKFSKKSWRAADIAIYDKATLKSVPLTNKYLEVAPEIVIEIDTKASLEEVSNPFGYYQEKTDQLLDFGVQKVIWIFTETRKIMVAEPEVDWQIGNWNKDISVMKGVTINVEGLLEDIV